MTECKHGLKSGCSYCHGGAPTTARRRPSTRAARPTRLSDKMNDRMTALKRRLRQLRGE